MSDVVLVTGASGFAGSHLVEHLCPEHEVAAWGRSTRPAEMPASVRWQRVDLLDGGQVRRALDELRPSAVYHCAGVPHVAGSWSSTAPTLEGNVLATHRLLDGLRRARIACRVLITGSATVYAPSPRALTEDDPLAPDSPYALSKLAQEQLGLRALREDGVDVLLTRSFNHTGPRQAPAFVAPGIARQIALIERGEREPVIRVGNLESTRDLSDVRDVVRAYAAIVRAGTPGTVYNVASGTGRRIRTVLESLLSRARVPVEVRTDAGQMRPSDASILVGDATRLRRATGWQPAIPFDRTLDDLLAYWRARAD